MIADRHTHEVGPWLNDFWGALIKAYKAFEARVGTLENKHGNKSSRARIAVLNRSLPFSISEIEPTGKGRSAKWRNCPSP